MGPLLALATDAAAPQVAALALPVVVSTGKAATGPAPSARDESMTRARGARLTVFLAW